MRSPKSHAIWNINHPDDPIKRGDGHIIHHKDGNHSNDHPNNHQKMTRGDHRRLHQSGDKHWLYGKHHSPSSKVKMRVAKIGTKLSEDHKQRIADANKGDKNAFYGQKHSDEARAKMRSYIKTSKHRLNLSLSHIGQPAWNKGKKNPLSEETKQRMKLGQQARRKRESNKKETEL